MSNFAFLPKTFSTISGTAARAEGRLTGGVIP